MFLRVQLAIASIGYGNGLAQNRWQAITWANVDPVQRRKYVHSRIYMRHSAPVC